MTFSRLFTNNYSQIINLLVFLAPALILVSPKGKGTVLITMALFLLSVLTLKKENFKNISPEEKFLFVALILFFLSALPNVILDTSNLRALDAPVRYLTIIPIYLFLKSHVTERTFYSYIAGVITGSVGAFFLALYQHFILNMPRVDGFLYSINFGYIASSLAIICAAMFFLGHRHKIIYLVGFIAASLAMLFSGTRGALIAYLITSFIISAFNLRKGNIKVVVIFSLIITLCLYALYGFNKSFSSRINNTISKVEAILNQDKGFTSVNARFEIWKSVLYMTKDNLWLGTGYNERAQKLQELIKQGKISKDIPFGKGHRNHGHNEVMEALVSKGLFGVLALLAFYWAFLRLFFKKAVGKKSETQYIAAVCGFLFVLQFILCGLTEAPLLRNAISAFFIVTVSFFIASLADKPIFSPD